MFAPRAPAASLYRMLALLFLSVTLLIVIGAVWISSARARITVKVRQDTTSIQTAIDVSKDPSPDQLRGRVVQGTFEKIQEFGVKERVATTSSNRMAQGTVKIINTYSKSQTLVKTTRLLTSDNRLFRIDQTVVVPPKQSVTVTARADKAGAEYVLPAGTRLTIPGLWVDLQKFIYAETVTAINGSQQAIKVVNTGDVAEAQATLAETVFEQAQKTLQAEAGVGDGWKAVYEKKQVDKKSNVAFGQNTDQFLASVSLQVTAVFFSEKDMEALIRQKLKQKLLEGRNLVRVDPAQIMYRIETADSKMEKARLVISATASSRLTDQSPQLAKTDFFGLSQEEARSKLLSVDGVESVDIRIRPAWIGKIPSIKDHVELIVQ